MFQQFQFPTSVFPLHYITLLKVIYYISLNCKFTVVMGQLSSVNNKQYKNLEICIIYVPLIFENHVSITMK
jgi:hypothetical protein